MMNESNQPDARDNLEEVLAEVMVRLDEGEQIDQEAIIREHPNLEERLREFFGNVNWMQNVAAPDERAVGDGQHETETIRYLGDYELLEQIGRGGMGVVYRARQQSLERIVAVKLIRAGRLADEREVKRFHEEAKAAAQLEHPGITPIFETGVYDSRHYFSMGYVRGSNLGRATREGPISAKKAAELVKKISEAMAYAHRHGVIHRDLKPANVLLNQAGEPKVTDFGLAKRLSSDQKLTENEILGTPSYMAPEQAEGRHDKVGKRSDVYSLGAILYSLLTARPPFLADNHLDTLIQVKEEEAIRPRRLNRIIPADVEWDRCDFCQRSERAEEQRAALTSPSPFPSFFFP